MRSQRSGRTIYVNAHGVPWNAWDFIAMKLRREQANALLRKRANARAAAEAEARAEADRMIREDTMKRIRAIRLRQRAESSARAPGARAEAPAVNRVSHANAISAIRSAQSALNGGARSVVGRYGTTNKDNSRKTVASNVRGIIGQINAHRGARSASVVFANVPVSVQGEALNLEGFYRKYMGKPVPRYRVT